MSTVAVATPWRLFDTIGGCLPVDRRHVVLLRHVMACAAGRGAELLLVRNVVDFVAIGALEESVDRLVQSFFLHDEVLHAFHDVGIGVTIQTVLGGELRTGHSRGEEQRKRERDKRAC